MIEVAHIYPYHSIKQKEENRSGPRYKFWNYLRAFWPEKKVTTWEAKLFPQGILEKGQEEVYNLISLAPTVHALWGRGLFALKPISESDDKKTLIVQFFWQEKQKGLLPKMSPTTIPISTQGLEQTAGVWLFDKNGKKNPIRRLFRASNRRSNTKTTAEFRTPRATMVPSAYPGHGRCC